jgi:hypothetical protein
LVRVNRLMPKLALGRTRLGIETGMPEIIGSSFVLCGPGLLMQIDELSRLSIHRMTGAVGNEP